MTKAAGQQIAVKVEGDVLTISIGVGLLAFAVQSPDISDWPHDFYVSDPATFAKAVARCLEDEEEDGTTPVHQMLDAAAVAALENGCDGVEEGDVTKGIEIARKAMGDQ